MYCTQCGSPRPDGATVCPACGKPVAQFSGYTAAAPAGSVPNYLVQSILVTLCCCLPGGIVALIFAAQVNSKLAAGDVAGAEAASRNAKMWCWISFGIGVLGALIGALSGLGD